MDTSNTATDIKFKIMHDGEGVAWWGAVRLRVHHMPRCPLLHATRQSLRVRW